ncbi:MAG: hypothetical protein J6K87_00155 [Clostridia bacterium]|nr:hypothetical protein [Clostridia bacterium]
MIKDEISDNNEQCDGARCVSSENKNVSDECKNCVINGDIECVSEDYLCDVGGGTFSRVAYGGVNMFRPKEINWKDLKPLKNNKVQDLTPGESLPSKNDEEL